MVVYREMEIVVHASSIIPSPPASSLHSRLLSVNFLTPVTRLAHKLSIGVRKVNARWLLMTPIACRTALRLSRPKTAGWLIHSRLASSSASRAATVLTSTPAVLLSVKPSVDRVLDIGGAKPLAPEWAEAVGEGVCFRSGVAEMGELSDPGWGVPGFDLLLAPDGTGTGGSPPLPSPFRMERVSFRRVCARSCWPRETNVNARVSMSEVRSSIRRWTICGWGGIGGLFCQDEDFFELPGAGSIVMANNDGRGRCIIVPSLSMSPQTRSAWISGNSSTETALWSSCSTGPPSASRPDTIVSQGSWGNCSWDELSGTMTSWTRMSRLSPNLRSPNELRHRGL